MAEKASKADVKYSPHGTRSEHCGICRHFEPPTTCEVVEGAVTKNGWCNRFDRWRSGKGDG